MVSLSDTYEKTYKAMGELQPIAFFLSASLVIAGIYAKDETLQVNHVYTLLASACFFFAYIDFLGFRLTNFKWFFALGIVSLAYAFYFIFRAALGLAVLAINLNDKLPSQGSPDLTEQVLFCMILSFMIILTAFSIIRLKNTRFSKHILFDKLIKSGFYFLYLVIVMVIFVQPTVSNMIGYGGVGAVFVDIFVLAALFIHSVLVKRNEVTVY